jgi:hypothetical protein
VAGSSFGELGFFEVSLGDTEYSTAAIAHSCRERINLSRRARQVIGNRSRCKLQALVR